MIILYLNHDFFEYDRAIEEQLSRMGHQVLSYKYVKLPNRFESVICRKEDGHAYRLACHNRQKSILKDIAREKKHIDAILVTAGHMLEENTLITLREMYPKAKFVWYLWDNVASIACYEINRHYFDRIISFDLIEARERGMKFLSDFYVYEDKDTPKLYDLSYIGTYRKERQDIVEQILQNSNLQNTFIYLYQRKENRLIDNLYDVYAKIMHKTHISGNKWCFDKMLSYREAINVVAQSKVVLDLCYSFQTGLSMRPFEAIAMRSKLITTNKNIVEYDFYNPNNIMVIDPENVVPISEQFLQSPYEELPAHILNKYSIQNWCKKIEDYLLEEEKDRD